MLKLINEQEKLVYETHGAKFIYRRIKPIERQNILRKYTRRGETDFVSAGLEMLKLCILNWEGVGDEKGEIEYSPELLEQLPDEVLSELIEIIGSAEVTEKK